MLLSIQLTNEVACPIIYTRQHPADTCNLYWNEEYVTPFEIDQDRRTFTPRTQFLVAAYVSLPLSERTDRPQPKVYFMGFQFTVLQQSAAYLW